MADNTWKFAKPASTCCVCAAPFEPAQPYFSALIQQPDALVRSDYCAGCFQDKRPPDVFYFWKTSLLAKDEAQSRRRERVDVEYVFEFFRRLEGDATPQRVAFRYILALMLTRQKLLVFEARKKDNLGQDVQIYREKRGGLNHSVYEPTLSDDEITSVSAELGVLLGLTPATPQAATEPAQGPHQ